MYPLKSSSGFIDMASVHAMATKSISFERMERIDMKLSKKRLSTEIPIGANVSFVLLHNESKVAACSDMETNGNCTLLGQL
jgi:hypothetical protein